MKKMLLGIILIPLMLGCSATRNTSAGNGGVNAVTSLKVNEKEQKSYSSIYDYLRSRVPGLLIRGTDISIRGINSVNSSTRPLILIDGVEVTDVSNLSPYDVESVEVIKDSATALYGFRGSGGVILIKTKAGKSE